MVYIDKLRHELKEINGFLASLENYTNYEGCESANVLIEVLGKSAKLLKNYENLLSGLISNIENSQLG